MSTNAFLARRYQRELDIVVGKAAWKDPVLFCFFCENVTGDHAISTKEAGSRQRMHTATVVHIISKV